MKNIFTVCMITFTLSSCIEVSNTYTQLPPGEWRGILKLSDPGYTAPMSAGEDVSKLIDFFELPFNMEVEYKNDSMEIFLVNAEEKLKADKVMYGRDPKTANDTIRIYFTAFDTYLDGFYEENYIEGLWHVNYKEGYSIPFIAEYGKNYRFDLPSDAPPSDFSGEWYATFEYDTEDSYPAIAQFDQDGNVLTGTFATETGDYRFLEGNVAGNKMKLSVFDGAHAFLFSGTLNSDTIYGEFRSGKHYSARWRAVRRSTEKLRDPYLMSRAEAETLDPFVFESSSGDSVSITDEQFHGKVKLVNIMGTWCPNCRDEIEFLKTLKNKYPEDQLAIISLAFERYRDRDRAIMQLRRYKESMNFDWPLLYGGYANKRENAQQLNFLDRIYSYPTMIMVDEENRIRYIHTGFYGPATREYEEFTESFGKKLDELINE